jgi:dihydrofolate reductase
MHHPIVSIIAGIGKNRELGWKNKLLWNIPEDLQWFRDKTNGHPVIMGRKTHESIGRVLPNRTNIVISRDPSYTAAGCIVCQTFEEAVEQAKQKDTEEVFVIGGASVYAQAIPIAQKLYLTVVDAEFTADTFFPEYSYRFKTIRNKKASSDRTFRYTFYELTP